MQITNLLYITTFPVVVLVFFFAFVMIFEKYILYISSGRAIRNVPEPVDHMRYLAYPQVSGKERHTHKKNTLQQGFFLIHPQLAKIGHQCIFLR